MNRTPFYPVILTLVLATALYGCGNRSVTGSDESNMNSSESGDVDKRGSGLGPSSLEGGDGDKKNDTNNP